MSFLTSLTSISSCVDKPMILFPNPSLPMEDNLLGSYSTPPLAIYEIFTTNDDEETFIETIYAILKKSLQRGTIQRVRSHRFEMNILKENGLVNIMTLSLYNFLGEEGGRCGKKKYIIIADRLRTYDEASDIIIPVFNAFCEKVREMTSYILFKNTKYKRSSLWSFPLPLDCHISETEHDDRIKYLLGFIQQPYWESKRSGLGSLISAIQNNGDSMSVKILGDILDVLLNLLKESNGEELILTTLVGLRNLMHYIKIIEKKDQVLEALDAWTRTMPDYETKLFFHHGVLSRKQAEEILSHELLPGSFLMFQNIDDGKTYLIAYESWGLEIKKKFAVQEIIMTEEGFTYNGKHYRDIWYLLNSASLLSTPVAFFSQNILLIQNEIDEIRKKL